MSTETKLLTAPSLKQETKSEKRDIPPLTPYREKREKKRMSDGDGELNYSIISPRARTRTRKARKIFVSAKMRAWLERLSAEGIQDPVPLFVDEAIRLTNGSEDDRRLWFKICNRGPNTFLGVVMDFEYDLTHHKHHPLRNPPSAFQKRLNRVLPKGGAR